MKAPDDDATLVVSRESAQVHTDLRVGSTINDRFVIEGILGRGGMGVVYRAKDLRKEEQDDHDPFVALKVLADEFQRDPRMVMALQREARKAQTLAHPNIATVYDFDRDGNVVYITMEALEGTSLEEAIAQHPGGMSKAEALPIIRGLCLGLAYAHNKNIIHSDFKPGNIFFSESHQTRILDFGIARAAPADRQSVQEDVGFDAGELGALTPAYAACEMFEGASPHPADDVYALAVVSYQLLSGRHPFENTPAPRARALDMQPEPIKGLNRREWRALRHGLAFERSERSQHAADFLRELEGGGRLKQVIGIAVITGIAFAGYIGYVQIQERARAAPDVPFEQLPQETRQQIRGLLDEAATFVGFGDPGSALILYREAYQLHPRNSEAVLALDSLFVELSAQAIQDRRRGDIERLQENLEVLMSEDDFLADRAALIEVRDALAIAAGDWKP